MELEQRVAELERRTNSYRNTLALLVVGICAVAVVGATTDDGEIRGRSLLLRNDQGKVVVSMGTDTKDNGRINVHSKLGTELIHAGVNSAGGHGQITVSTVSGADLIYAGADYNGHGRIKIMSSSGTDLVFAGAHLRDGSGVLEVNSKSGTSLLYAGAQSNGNGFIISGYNKTGEQVVQLLADEYGNGLVGAFNRKGKGRTLQPGP